MRLKTLILFVIGFDDLFANSCVVLDKLTAPASIELSQIENIRPYRVSAFSGKVVMVNDRKYVIPSVNSFDQLLRYRVDTIQQAFTDSLKSLTRILSDSLTILHQAADQQTKAAIAKELSQDLIDFANSRSGVQGFLSAGRRLDLPDGRTIPASLQLNREASDVIRTFHETISKFDWN